MKTSQIWLKGKTIFQAIKTIPGIKQWNCLTINKLLLFFYVFEYCLKSARLKSSNQLINLITCSFCVKNVCGFQGYKFLVYSGIFVHSEDSKSIFSLFSFFTVIIHNIIPIVPCCLWLSTTHLLLWYHPSSSVTLGKEVSIKRMMYTKPFFFIYTSSILYCNQKGPAQGSLVMWSAVHCPALHWNSLQFIALQYIVLQYIVLHRTALNVNAMSWSAKLLISSNYSL